jgi:hypothetical protein
VTVGVKVTLSAPYPSTVMNARLGKGLFLDAKDLKPTDADYYFKYASSDVRTKAHVNGRDDMARVG